MALEKMQVVVDILRANPNVVVVGGRENVHVKNGEWPSSARGFWSRTLDIFVHPARPLYDADKLNEFMLGLVPDPVPTCVDGFEHDGNKGLQLGKLYFDETIGTAALSATVQIDPDLSAVRHGVLVPSWAVERNVELRQRTWVSVYPDAGHLADAAEGRNTHHIPADDLGRRPGRVVADLFGPRILGGVIDASGMAPELGA